MKKDAQVTFRIQSDLKKELETIAASEGRSVGQVCEAFLKASCRELQEEGYDDFLKRFLAQHRPRQKST